MITYAIGDIHGCFDKMCELILQCVSHAAGRERRFITLGDYVDRGPQSREVVSTLMTPADQRGGVELVCLKGNHEDMLLEAQDENDSFAVDHWLSNGGAETLTSYGSPVVPNDHVNWMRGLPLFYDDGKRFFCHGGIDPRRPLSNQAPLDLMWWSWKRPEYDDIDPGRLIVHGHTPTKNRQPASRPYRLNIDTGAVFGGPLTAAVFNDEQVGPIGFITDTEGFRTA